MFGLTILTTFCKFFCLFHWIEKQDSALERLESCGTKIMLSGSIVHKPCVKKGDVSLKMGFFHTFNIFIYAAGLLTLAKDSSHAKSLFGAI